MHVLERRTRSFLGMMEPPRWNTGICQKITKILLPSGERNVENIHRNIFLIAEGVGRTMIEANLLSYRGNCDRDVEILAAIVLLVGEEVVPNLKNTKKTMKSIKSKRGKCLKFCPDRHVSKVGDSSYLVFTRQISSDTRCSFLCHWMNQQISPCSQDKECQLLILDKSEKVYKSLVS